MSDPALKATETVSLLGLGRMGEPMARNLLGSIGELTVWNRTESRAERLRELGATMATTAAEAAASITLTVLTDLSDVEQVLDGASGLLAGWATKGIENPVLVVHGTVSPIGVVALGERLSHHGVRVVDAPLSGGVAGAEAASLSIMVGGSASDVDRVLPTLQHLGRTAIHLGPLGSGELAKACNQIVVAATVEAVSEALVLADTAGLDRRQLLAILDGGLASSEVLRQKSPRWSENEYGGGGSSANQLKDLRFIQESADSYGIHLPLAEAMLESFTTAVEIDGEGALDHSAIVLSIARHARKEAL